MAFVAFIVFAGCASEPERLAPVDQGARYAKPLGYIEWLAHSERFQPISANDHHTLSPDSFLEWRAQSILLEPSLGAERVEVFVEEQNVVLSGIVGSRESAQRIVESMKQIEGVVHIADLMTVEP